MRAFVVSGPRTGAVEDVAPPIAEPGQVLVEVERVGLCGTDVDFFAGEMAYLHQGHARYPIRLGHEWCGTVSAVGNAVDPGWIGRRTTADTMLGCGHCDRCLSGRQHLCEDRFEIGIRRGWPGALAEQMAVPVTALQPLPDAVDAVAGALVEPGANALRTRALVLKDATAVGVLSGSGALAEAIELYASSAVDPRPLVAATVRLDQVGAVLGGWRPEGAGPGPKMHVDPRS